MLLNHLQNSKSIRKVHKRKAEKSLKSLKTEQYFKEKSKDLHNLYQTYDLQ